MRSPKSTATPNAVDVRSLIHLYVTTLEARGYRPSVIGAYRAAVEHFVSWAAPGGDRLEVSKAAVRHFLNGHLADCKCSGRVQRGIVTVRSALNHLLTILGETRLASEVKLPAHLDTELRASASTQATFVDSRLQRLSRGGSGLDVFWFTSFPREASMFRDYRRNKSGTSSLPSAKATDRALHRWSPPPFAVIYGSGALQHADQVESLLAAVPSAACWRLAALPQYLEADELASLMAGVRPNAASTSERLRDRSLLG